MHNQVKCVLIGLFCFNLPLSFLFFNKFKINGENNHILTEYTVGEAQQYYENKKTYFL